MLASIPVQLLRERTIELLSATRTISMGRDRDPVQEPDNAIRAKVLLACIEQDAGAAPTRKPIEAKPATDADKLAPGVLRPGGKAER